MSNSNEWAANPQDVSFDQQDFVSPPTAMPPVSSSSGQEQADDSIPEPTAFYPPSQGAFVPPAGRMYAQPRMPPTWQPPGYLPPVPQGMGEYFSQRMAGGVLQEALGGLAQILGGATAGYLLTSDWSAAAGAGLVVAGLGQLPHVMGHGGTKRAAIGGVCLVGAYLLLKDKSELLSRKSGRVPMAPWMKSEKAE